MYGSQRTALVATHQRLSNRVTSCYRTHKIGCTRHLPVPVFSGLGLWKGSLLPASLHWFSGLLLVQQAFYPLSFCPTHRKPFFFLHFCLLIENVISSRIQQHVFCSSVSMKPLKFLYICDPVKLPNIHNCKLYHGDYWVYSEWQTFLFNALGEICRKLFLCTCFLKSREKEINWSFPVMKKAQLRDGFNN